MRGAGAWMVVATMAWCARAGPGPPEAGLESAPAPALVFEHALYNVSIPENSPARTYAAQPPGDAPLGVRLPEPGARLRFRIRHGDKDKFFKAEERTVGDFCFLLLRTRAGHADVLNRERRAAYRLDVRASATLLDGSALDADVAVALDVTDENDLSPLFYPTEYEALVPEDAPLHSSLLRVSAEDADLGLNGEIYYSLAEPSARFAVHPTTGTVTLTRPLAAADAEHRFEVVARDRASLLARGEEAPAARAAVTVRVRAVNLHAPRLAVRRLPALPENSAGDVYAIVTVTDPDPGEHGRIASLEIVDGDPDGHFRVRPSAQAGEYDVLVHALLDREAAPRPYNLTLCARDAGTPPRVAYAALPVTLLDADDNAPVFSRELYEAGVPETAPPDTPVIRLKASDRDEGPAARVYFEIVGGNEGGEFRLHPDTGVLYTAAELDAERRALYTLTVAAVDRGAAAARLQSSAKVKVTVLDANDNAPEFEAERLDVEVAENGPGGAVVARVAARDADAGDNGYVSYSLANLEPVPFDVDHFSGAVRTTRLLDYESMRREYSLRVRASDWGAPFRRQAEALLAVRLRDVNDNRPQFERVECAGYVSRRLPIGAEIATLSAIDFDAGDVVSYRITAGNEDNCFALDAARGVLSVACDLSDVRAESRALNVTATDGTHFADESSLQLRLTAGAGDAALECRDTGVARRLTDLLAAAARANAPPDPVDPLPPEPERPAANLHAPEFIDFPVEVKVNESVALGTTLVRVRARDRDAGYDGLVTFALSGGDGDSAFRVDADTGELQVIGYLDREREAEYYLNVTAYDQGRPRRAASRLLPVTVLDVNDNAPRFEKTLASFRVTENALNGTAIFRANATDRDAGEWARLSYTVSGADRGEFCVERDTGVLRVCAPLDRERRALYELTVRAEDGGGRAAEALVRVAVDDVNDEPPRFPLATYAARVREDVPRGTLLAALEALDPDLGAGGHVRYSLPPQPDAAAFSIDELSGAVRTAAALDYELRQVYGVTVRATDGGQPALWAEATLIVEVEDVDENRHAPAWAARGALAAAVREDAARGTSVLAAPAADRDAPGRDSRLAYYLLAGSGLAHFSVDDEAVLRTLTPLDRETAPHYWLTLCAHDHGLVPRHACIQVYVEVTDVNDEAPWPSQAAYRAAVAEGAPPRTPVARVVAADADAAPANVSYAIVAGNPDGLFSIDERTGEVATTGRALDREAAPAHALEVRCSDGELSTTARLTVTVTDVNDHAPAFTQRFYEVRAPLPPADPADPAPTDAADPTDPVPADGSAEWDDEEDESGGWETQEDEPADYQYITTVVALDPDEGANGTVRYWWRARGGARGAVRVGARSGRVWAAPRALRAGAALALAVRACDAAPRPRCSVARVAVRAVPPGGGAPPALVAPPPLAAAELDPPGFLLAVLQATDAAGDRLYYALAGGDPQQQFALGREDGGLTLLRRLVWEHTPQYLLNVSVTDGAHTVYTIVTVTVIDDAAEGGVAFAQEHYELEVSEQAAVGTALARLAATAPPHARLLYGVHAARAPASAALFRLHELSGVLELAAPLDSERAAEHRLTVWARDQAPRASLAFARVTVRVRDADEHAPAWGRRLAEARVARTAAPGTLVAALRAGDADARAAPPRYSAAGGGGVFAVDARGDVRLARPLPPGAREYTLAVRAAAPPPAARAATLPLHITVVEPDDAPPRFLEEEVECEVAENLPAGSAVCAVEARGGAGLVYWLSGGRGLFRLNPAAGLLATAAPLDHEAQSEHRLTVTAANMGGGRAEARVLVRVLDVNEFPPRLTARRYRGRVSEAAGAGAAVRDAAGEPLVLAVDDADSPANRRCAYEIVEPEAAALFRVDPATGALRLAAPLDYERAASHRFTVRALDAGSPRLPAASAAEVLVDVEDVDDCAPAFARAAYEATVLTPTAAGVTVAELSAADPDPPPGGLKFDVLEGDPAGAFAVSARGVVSVARPGALAAAHRLRVRVSDGAHAATARLDVAVRAPDDSGLAFQRTDYYGSVVENSTRPTTIAVLNVVGAALGEHVEFRILNPHEGFEVGRTSGAVRSAGRALDREERDQYELLVEARAGPRSARARLHVAVTDVNDNCPVFVGQPYAAAVLAGAPPGTEVLTVRALDADASDNGEVRYEMKRGHGELFHVERRSGRVTLKQAPEAAREYTLEVAAFDGGVPPCAAAAAVSVRVWAGGAAPAWPAALLRLAAREDWPPGAPLAPPLQARSPLRRPLLYSLVDDAGGLLEVHYETGAVSVRAALDYEAAAALRGVVRATDALSGAHADAALVLDVLDVNDCAPQFARAEFAAEVSEAAPRGHRLLTVAATDCDQGEAGALEYSLVAADGEPTPFSVDAHGAVSVAAPLDAETRAAHHLLLTASDRGAPPLATTVRLRVAVADVNDCAPRLERAVLAAAVSAEAARGTAVARVAAWDPDARDAPRLRYRLHGAERAFRLHPRTGVLSVWGAVGAAPHALNVSVSDGAHAAFARVKLTPAPVNRAAPHFPHAVHEARAPENAAPPLLLTTVKAYDDDAGDYGRVSYSIPSARLRETFAVDAATGALTTRVPLDRERRALWEVGVTAGDGGGLLRHTVVRVRVTDENDNAPQFPLREYRAAVRADRPPGAAFLTVSATDADAGEAARLSYSLHAGAAAHAGVLRVDAASGALSLAREASAWAGGALAAWVRARDGGGRAAEAPVLVWVLAPGDEGPRLRAPPPLLWAREDAAPGAALAALAVPGEAALRWRLAAGAAADVFAVDAAGRLTVAAPLDRETAPEHYIGVIAEAASGAAAMAVVRVRLLDVNEHAPVFHAQPYVVHLAENAPPHSSVVQLAADDPDAGANGEVRYSLAEEEAEGGALFAVDPSSGWVTTLAALDREARPEHRLALLAADGGDPPLVTRGTLVVRLVDYNDCPPAFERAEYAAAVREDAAPGTVAARLAVRDADAVAAPLAFFLVSGDERARFQLRASGELLVARALDREAVAAYELAVAATDGKFTAHTRVRVAVLDVNDNPPECAAWRYSARLAEDAAPGARVAALETRDADDAPNARPRYYLTGDDAHHFAMDKETGVVSVAAALDREARAHYRLRMHAQDRARAAFRCSAELAVELLDVNDNAPRFSAASYSVTLPEDAEPGTLVAKLHAADADLGENRTVSYHALDGSDGALALRPDGLVTLRAALDRERAAEHRLVVLARDAGRPARSATATLRLTVADVNDNPPEFERRAYRAAVSELAAPGGEVLRVRAASADQGVNAEVRYALVAGDHRDDFELDARSGALRVARPLDHERRRHYRLTVQAVDGGAPPLSDRATLDVTVLDANDNAPAFSQPSYSARVREDAAPGTRVLQLIADDADAGANGRVEYELARGDPDGRFAVDADTGYLSVAAPLDREAAAAYTLTVTARDRGAPRLEAAARVDVEVTDVNDNPPRFERADYEATVREDRPLGHLVLRLAVDDADAPPNGAPFTFDLRAGDDAGAFRLEQDGSLRTATRFNRRITAQYSLRVRVFDNGLPPLYADACVAVRVLEAARYPPAVSALDVTVNSYLDEFPGGVIGRVAASDRDADDVLAYALAPAADAAAPLFAVDAADGTLRAAAALDAGEYRLNVTVGDGKFVSWAPVTVRVALVPEEALAAALVVRFRGVGEAAFVERHRRGFERAVAEACERAPPDVLVLSVQAHGAELDVAVAVRGAAGYLPADALRRRLHDALERLEERAQLVVEELPRAACAACAAAACRERVRLAGAARALGGGARALVAARHELRGECAGAGAVTALAGDGFLEWSVARGAVAGARLLDDELVVSLRFRTARARGTLLWAAGAVDELWLELAEGRLQARLQLGAGEARVRAAAPAADGRWHEARLERRGAALRLTLDRRSAHGAAPPPHAVLDARRRLLAGAALLRHAGAQAAEQVSYGFDGCIADLKLDGVALPLEAGDGDDRVRLTRRVRARALPACPAHAPPDACQHYPCLHGGTCRPAAAPAGHDCVCHARFSGARCELDSDPCAAQPCLHGGTCAASDAGYECRCAPGLEGARCERGRWCVPGACAHGGACEEGEDGPSCVCRGYYGAACEHDVDECAGEPCLNGATCLNEPGSFRCVCPPDRTGMNCGNPLYSDAVVAGGAAGGARALRDLWHWALAERWPLVAAAGALAALALLLATPLLLRRRRAPPPPYAAHAPPRSKLSNLEAVRRERPASAADPPPLNNADTLRSYGSAGDELEGIPPDYRRNLNIEPADRKPWSEQMHLHTFVDNKIYNDLKGGGARRAGEPHLVGGYHWDCSDWCGGGGALPGISEVAGSERPDSSSAASPPPDDSAPDSAPDDASARLLAGARRDRDDDSLITMLEERTSLLGRSASELSARVCEIEDSDEDSEAAETDCGGGGGGGGGGARHTAV